VILHFIVDAQLPPALVDQLRRAGHDADHVNTIGFGAAEDAEIWAYASRRRSVIITKDEDFVALVTRDPTGPAVVWVRLGNTTRRTLWHALEPLLPELVEGLGEGERLIEIR
jgi:predicted nuclease of predicted toxin-antitoxin system